MFYLVYFYFERVVSVAAGAEQTSACSAQIIPLHFGADVVIEEFDQQRKNDDESVCEPSIKLSIANEGGDSGAPDKLLDMSKSVATAHCSKHYLGDTPMSPNDSFSNEMVSTEITEQPIITQNVEFVCFALERMVDDLRSQCLNPDRCLILSLEHAFLLINFEPTNYSCYIKA